MPDFLFNRLAGETSPYLQQHKDNPVAWQPWDAEALAAARASNRPILLSIGYAACHWCHVMAHESFEDPDVAAVMNGLFVNIKVDREERPDLDQIYQSAHQLLTGRAGGWPLTMFLTPEGMPFFGGTYFPKSRRHDLPGFVDVCLRVAEAYRTRGDEIDRQNGALQTALAQTLPHGTGELDAGALDVARNALLQNLDRGHGGFGDAPKFPQATALAFLLDRGDEEAAAAALLTLTRMAQGGVFDQIGGGLFRYSVDARWDIPHFEKMLYDNALLLPLYAEAWRRTRQPVYEHAAATTAAWLMREMQSSGGGYFASLDADTEGEEGRYYVWEREEIRALLTPSEWQAAQPAWGLDQPPNFENRLWHLHRTAAPVCENDLAAARETLLRVRNRRTPPGRDEKILTAWNALAIAGMARAARLCEQPAWLGSARQALEFLRRHVWRDGRLLASWKDRATLGAYLDDHAYLLAALLEVLQADYRREDMEWAIELADALLERFEDKAAGGFHFTANDHEALIYRPKPGFDNATPAGNGVAAIALQRLGHLLGETRYLDAARRTLEVFGAQLAHPASASLLTALSEYLKPPGSTPAPASALIA